jgi:hypothetical protein
MLVTRRARLLVACAMLPPIRRLNRRYLGRRRRKTAYRLRLSRSDHELRFAWEVRLSRYRGSNPRGAESPCVPLRPAAGDIRWPSGIYNHNGIMDNIPISGESTFVGPTLARLRNRASLRVGILQRVSLWFVLGR